tara:strand:+ start:1036 stop:1299 length:264 start_codon:yes stop_codon:yes gene_type:complete
MKKVILEKFNEALAQTNKGISYEDIENNKILLDTGLDSLGFAVLISLLEEELDFDPFQEMEEAIYPTTFGEFVKIYENRNGKKKSFD